MPTNLENEALEALTKTGGEARRQIPHTAVDRYGRPLSKSFTHDADGNAITSTTVGGDQALDVNVVQTVGGGGGGDATAANQTTIIGHVDGIETLLTDIESNQLPDGHNVTVDNASIAVTAASLPLPTDAATEATLAAVLTALQAQSNLPTSIGDGAKTVSSAGTAEALLGSTSCVKVIMTAEDDNSGKIYYGGSGVSSTSGDYLFPAQKITIEIDDVSKIFIDADTSTDGVKFTYFA